MNTKQSYAPHRKVFYKDRAETQNQGYDHTETTYQRDVETRLLPNEMRISSRGNMNQYFENAMAALEKFRFLKIVARGSAVPLAEDIASMIVE